MSDTHCCNTFGLVTAYRVPRLHWDINRDDLRTGHVVRISANHHPPPTQIFHTYGTSVHLYDLYYKRDLHSSGMLRSVLW